jgi:hypothetical protein
MVPVDTFFANILNLLPKEPDIPVSTRDQIIQKQR